jgi:hypothetical protein
MSWITPISRIWVRGLEFDVGLCYFCSNKQSTGFWSIRSTRLTYQYPHENYKVKKQKIYALGKIKFIMHQMQSRRLEIRSESAIQMESQRLLTWVRLPGPMVLVPLVHIRVKPTKIIAQEGADGRVIRIRKLHCKLCIVPDQDSGTHPPIKGAGRSQRRTPWDLAFNPNFTSIILSDSPCLYEIFEFIQRTPFPDSKSFIHGHCRGDPSSPGMRRLVEFVVEPSGT